MVWEGVKTVKEFEDKSVASAARYSRTVRVNMLKMMVDEVMEVFWEDGYECVVDFLIDMLLVFFVGMDLYAYKFVKTGAVVL